MALIKTTELPSDDSNPLQTEAFLMNTALGSVQTPRSAIPGLSSQLLFLSEDDDGLNITEEEHYLRFLSCNNSTGAINLVLPDANLILPNVDSLRFGGLFFSGAVASPNFDFSISASSPAAGNLRFSSPNLPDLAVDQAFIGLNQVFADEAVFRVYIRGSIYVIESLSGWRAASGDFRDRELDVTAEVDRQIVNVDQYLSAIWLTAANPGTLTFQVDIASGTSVQVVNQGSSPATFDFGGHTQVGDSSVAPGQAASIIVGPPTAGVSKEIFIAASS